MSISSPLLTGRSSIRSITARMLGHRAHRRDDRVDRTTSPTDFVLSDYRHVR